MYVGSLTFRVGRNKSRVGQIKVVYGGKTELVSTRRYSKRWASPDRFSYLLVDTRSIHCPPSTQPSAIFFIGAQHVSIGRPEVVGV